MAGIGALFLRRGGSVAAVLLVLGVLVVLGPTTAQGATRTVVNAEISVDSEAFPSPKDPGRCVAARFLEFPEVRGAKSYEGTVFDSLFGRDVSFRGPPFSGDDYSLFPFKSVVAAGHHRWSLAAFSSPTGCGDAIAAHAERFSKPRVVAIGAEGSSIEGTVLDEEKTPVSGVTISARGKTRLRARTDGSGQYRIVVPKGKLGKYTVRVTSQDGVFKPKKRDVTVRKNQTVRANFKHVGCTVDRRGSEHARSNERVAIMSGSVATHDGCLTQRFRIHIDADDPLTPVREFEWDAQFYCRNGNGDRVKRQARLTAPRGLPLSEQKNGEFRIVNAWGSGAPVGSRPIPGVGRARLLATITQDLRVAHLSGGLTGRDPQTRSLCERFSVKDVTLLSRPLG